MTAHVVSVLMGGLFHAAVLFLVAAGLQVVFGVQRIFNLACGSFYALGAYVGVAAVQAFIRAGGPPELFVLPLAIAGLLAGLTGIVVERGLLRFIYDRDETYVVFLSREADGTYTSVVTSRFKVEQGGVDHWQGRGVVPIEDVKREIAALVAP